MMDEKTNPEETAEMPEGSISDGIYYFAAMTIAVSSLPDADKQLLAAKLKQLKQDTAQKYTDQDVNEILKPYGLRIC